MAVFVAIFVAVGVTAATARADHRIESRKPIDEKFANELEQLAELCEQLKLPEQAKISRDWFIHRDPQRSYIFLPPAADSFQPDQDAEKIAHQWYRRFSQVRQDQASRLFELAKVQLEKDRADLAYQLLNEVLHEYADHQEARRILGYRIVNGVWRIPTGQIIASRGRVKQADFQWRAGNYWQVNSEHFRIVSNGEKEEAIELAEQLEKLHRVWKQIFFPYWSNRASLQRRFAESGQGRLSRKRHIVVLFKNRDDYNRTLSGEIPGIENSLGYYSSQRRESMLFGQDKATITTWMHEVTHQLFQESFRTPIDVGLDNNFWLVEGIAVYMESMVDHQRYVALGGFDSPRLQFAHFRLMNERFFVPLEQLSQWGRDAFQRHEMVGKLYSQSAGFIHYLMDGQEGRLRIPLIETVRTLYTGKQDVTTLAQNADTSFARLDTGYQDFMSLNKSEVLRFMDDARSLGELSLSYSNVDDEVLARVKRHRELRWLSLSGSAVTSAGMEHLKSMNQLTQLFVDRTAVDDEGLKAIGKIESLQEINLANSKITDAGLAHLTGLKNLVVLNIEGCDISEKALADLRRALPRLGQ